MRLDMLQIGRVKLATSDAGPGEHLSRDDGEYALAPVSSCFGIWLGE
jgi:hypothetical protein